MTTRLGALVRRLREGKRLTQPELADQAGVSPSYLSRIETGGRKNITIKVARNLARALGYPLGDFLRDAGIAQVEVEDPETEALLAAILNVMDALPIDEMEAELKRLRILADYYRREAYERKRAEGEDDAEDARSLAGHALESAELR